VGSPMGPPPESVVEYFSEWLAKDGYPFWPFWENIRSWWEIRELPNVLLLHFEDLKRDMPGEIRRMAEFLGIPIDESKWDAILEHCSFDYMKKNAVKSVPLGGVFWEGGAQTFINKGINGRWRDLLSDEESAEYERVALANLDEDCAQWLASGKG
jgi:aryl sulfotransferase